MLNEWQEFQTYTGEVNYTAEDTRDVAYMRRFTFEMLLDFEGLVRVLTIIARGYLFHDREGNVLKGNPRERIDYVRRAICAWCSVPDWKKASADDTDINAEEKKYATEFAELHGEFPELVDKRGNGWFCRHVKGIAKFMAKHPEKVRKTSRDKLPALKKSTQHGGEKFGSFRFRHFPMRPKGSGTPALIMFSLKRWNWGRCAGWSWNCPMSSWRRFALQFRRKFLKKWCSLWWPTTLPTDRRTPIGSSCR